MNSAITAKLDKYLRTPAEEHDRNLRKLDYTLIKFLTRASMKTSPFANLTYSGIGNFNGAQKTGAKRLYPRLNDSLILQVYDKLFLDPEWITRLEYRLNATSVELEGKYYITVLQNTKGERQLYKSRQGLVTLRASEALRKLFGSLQEAEALPYAAMRELFTALGVSGEQADDTLRQLIGNGVLERTEYLNEQAGNLSEELLRKLERYGVDHPCIPLLHELNSLTGQFADSLDVGATERLYHCAEALAALFDLEPMPRRSLLYIDGIDETLQTQDYSNREKRLAQLSRYQWLMMCFDTVVKMQFAAGEFFKNHYGTSYVPANSQEASKVLRDMAQVFFSDTELLKETSGLFNWDKAYSHKRTQRLHNIARRLTGFLNEAAAESEILIPDAQTAAWQSEIQEVLGERLLSHSFFVQESGDSMVLNHMYKGFSIYFARFLKYLEDSGSEYSAYLRECFDGNQVADIRNTFGFNANIRKRTVQKEIALPIQSMTESGQSLSWLDLGFRYNASTESPEFFEQATGNTVRPQFLGTLVLVAAPAILTTFDILSSHGTSYFDLGELILRERLKPAGGSDEAVIHVPRIWLGDRELMVSREKWLLNTSVLSEAFSEKDRFEAWKRAIDYFDANGIPTRFYTRPFSGGAEPASEVTERKPQFINLSSPLLFQVFMQLAAKGEYIVIEEEFPVAAPEQDNVLEYTYEITCGGEAEYAAANY
ncbi:lantibiotic dehydratase [Paenibacillus sp. CGMCC 1.18879]|uniref:lantibiotic dehydratase n=1 Tax=Paenibacillus sp. CGMCC 1.18879 TaxID=2834466 RepID=UPI0039778076